jgi:hypothetical protein
MSLILLTRDKHHLGGVYLGAVTTDSTLYLGNGYISGLCGLASDSNTLRVTSHFEEIGSLLNVHEGDDAYKGRQYGFLTKNNFFHEHSGLNRATTFMLIGNRSAVFGNTLINDIPMFENILSFLDESNLSVKERLIKSLKDNKRIGIDVRVKDKSSTDLRIIVGDYMGNTAFEKKLYKSPKDPIDLI